MSKENYKIICQRDGRVIASIDMQGNMTIHHDHFKDGDNVEISRFISAIDRFAYCRNIQHLSKRGLNYATVEEVNTLQREKPGKVYLGPPQTSTRHDPDAGYYDK